MPKLTIRRGPTVVHELDLDGRELLIGRGDQSDVVLPDPTMAVSRVHAKLRQENGTYILTDNGSQNGIWSEGEQRDQIVLEPGLEVMIGEYTLALSDAAPSGYGTGPFVEDLKTVYAPPQIPADLGPSQQPARPPRPASSMRLSKGMLFGGSAFILVFGLALYYVLKPSCASVEGPSCNPDSNPTTTTTVSAGVSDSQIEQKTEHVRKAKQLIDAQKFDEALEEINAGLALPGDNAELLGLRDKVTEVKNAALTTTTSIKGRVVIPPPQPPPATTTPVTDRFADRYAAAKKAFDSGNFQEAINLLQQIDREQPGYRDVADLLARARAELKRLVQQELEAAANAERMGDLLEARRLYQRAAQLGAQVEAELKRLGDLIKSEGNKALTDAVAYAAYGRIEKAIELYERAYRYLPDGDPGKKEAKDKLDKLRGSK